MLFTDNDNERIWGMGDLKDDTPITFGQFMYDEHNDKHMAIGEFFFNLFSRKKK